MDRISSLTWAVIFLGLLAFFSLILLIFFSRKVKENKFIDNHRIIRPGMEKRKVINLLGDRYTQSYLKDGSLKLEWRFKTPGYAGRVARGAYLYSQSSTRKICVYFVDNRVTEVKSYNMD